MQQYQQQHGNSDMNGGFNALFNIAYGHALIMIVFLRSNLGREAVGFYGIFSLAMIFLWGGLTNSFAMFIFLGAFVLALISQRMKTFKPGLFTKKAEKRRNHRVTLCV